MNSKVADLVFLDRTSGHSPRPDCRFLPNANGLGWSGPAKTACRSLEGGHYAVARGLDQSATTDLKLCLGDPVVLGEKPSQAAVPTEAAA